MTLTLVADFRLARRTHIHVVPTVHVHVDQLLATASERLSDARHAC